MILRLGVALAMVAGLAACRPSGPSMALGGPGFSQAAEAAPRVRPAPVPLPQKTMGDRILAAIALERVTGLVPDPAKFLEDH